MKSTRSMYTSMFPWLRCCGEDSQGKTVTSDHTDDDGIFMKQTTHNRNMDNRFRGEKMCGVLKTEQEKPLPLRQQWGSVESDTESLAQEKAYQQQLHNGRRDDHIKYIRFPKDSMDSLQLGYEDDEDSNDDATEDLQVYDSLEVTAHSHAKSSPALLQGEYLATQINERERTSSKLLSDDAYSDLRYDPNWRTNLKGADHLSDGPQISIDEQYQVPEEKSSKAFADRQRLLIKGGYRYVVDTGPPVVSPYVTGNESDQPYCLLQEDSHTSSVTSPHCHNQALLHSPPEADLSRPSTIFTKHQSNNKCENIWYNDGEDIRRSSELLTEKINAMCIQEHKTYHQQELRRTADGPTPLSTSALISPKVLSNRKLERPTDDIVERNKKTLGRNTSKCGSYATVHALKQERPHNVNKVHESPKEAASTESQEDSSDPMLRCLQETPHLTEPQVTQISTGKKSQGKESPNPPPQQQQQQQQQQQHPALRVRNERGDCLSSRPAPVTQPLAPTIHLNINLNSSSHLIPLLQQKGQDAIINLASLHGYPHWSPASSEVSLASSHGYQQINPGKSSQMSRKGVNAQLHHRKVECSTKHWQRAEAVLQWPLSSEGEEQKWSPNEFHSEQVPLNLPRTPTTSTASLGSGSYTVLPPIGTPVTGKEPELTPGQNVQTTYPIHRSSSDGYLVHMEKQKQLRTKVAYKAYSLKDYRLLKSDVNLRGLGPDYTAIDKTKMKRQKLYSNVIREQNKKISRIPFLLAKDPEGNDKKVPRIKALEYAKTIAKPSVQCQAKPSQKHQSEDFTEHAPCLKDLEVFQPSALEVLRKRHEEEKQAVARFTKVHPV